MKQIIKPQVKIFFEEEFGICVSKILFARKQTQINHFKGFVYSELSQKHEFYVNFEDECNYTISLYVNQDDLLYHKDSVQSLISNNLLLEKFKIIEALDFKFKNFFTKVIDCSIFYKKTFKSNQSQVTRQQQYFLMNSFGSKTKQIGHVPAAKNMIIKFTDKTISFKDDFIKFFHTNKAYPPMSDYKGVGLQTWTYNEENIDKVLNLLYYNFFYYITYYNSYKSPFDYLSLDDVFQMNYKDLHYVFITEHTVNKMIAI